MNKSLLHRLCEVAIAVPLAGHTRRNRTAVILRNSFFPKVSKLRRPIHMRFYRFEAICFSGALKAIAVCLTSC